MATSDVMDWLAQGISLSLLCDLADPAGPDSLAICSVERPASDPIWLEATDAVAASRRRRWLSAG